MPKNEFFVAVFALKVFPGSVILEAKPIESIMVHFVIPEFVTFPTFSCF